MAKPIKKKKISRIRTKKKTWFKINAPKLFGNKEIGETYLAVADKAVGRVMKVNLRDITDNVRDQNAYISFRITGVDGTTLQTSVIGYQLTSAYVKRLVRKNTARLDDYFEFRMKDGKEIILKSLLVTVYKTRRSTKTALRKELQGLLEEELQKVDFSAFIGNLVRSRMQSTLKKKLSKIFPVKGVNIRCLELTGKAASQEAKEKSHSEKPIEKARLEKPIEKTVAAVQEA